MLETFHGYVSSFDKKRVNVIVEDAKGVEEVWVIERKKVPESWLAPGAIFDLTIDAKSGVVRWTFDSSFLTAEDMREIKERGKTLYERFGLPKEN